jgi:hypothetical protein
VFVGQPYTPDAEGSSRVNAPDSGAYEFGATVEPPVATALAFQTQPSTTVVNGTISPAVQVRVVDQFGATFPSSASITLSIGSNPGGGTLQGTLTQPAVSGVATFANLTLTAAGTGYSLVAASAGLPNATSNPFTITAQVAAYLSNFEDPPAATPVGAIMTPPFIVAAFDASGTVVTGYTTPITIGLQQNPAGGVLSGTLTRTPVGGQVSFDDLRVDTVGTGYTFGYSSGTLPPSQSGFFAITSADPGQVQLGWDYTQGSTPATGFVVQRQEACTGAWTDRPGMPLPVATLSYTDTGLSAANTYCWRVLAVDAAGTRSETSNTAQWPMTIEPPTDLIITGRLSGHFFGR